MPENPAHFTAKNTPKGTRAIATACVIKFLKTPGARLLWNDILHLKKIIESWLKFSIFGTVPSLWFWIRNVMIELLTATTWGYKQHPFKPKSLWRVFFEFGSLFSRNPNRRIFILNECELLTLPHYRIIQTIAQSIRLDEKNSAKPKKNSQKNSSVFYRRLCCLCVGWGLLILVAHWSVSLHHSFKIKTRHYCYKWRISEDN